MNQEEILDALARHEDRITEHIDCRFVSILEDVQNVSNLLEKTDITDRLIEIISRQEKFEELLDKNYRHINEMQRELKSVVSMARAALAERKQQDGEST